MTSDLAQLWATCRASLRQQVPEPTWNTYLAPLLLLEGADSQFVVGAPNSMILERVATRYQGMIEGALVEASCGEAVKLELVVHAEPGQGTLMLDGPDAEDGEFPPHHASNGELAQPPAMETVRPAPVASSHGPGNAAAPSRNDRRPHLMLNPALYL